MMDPKANIERQLLLATNVAHAGRNSDQFEREASELAELVIELDAFLRNGGLGPYDQPVTAAEVLAQAYDTDRTLIQGAVQRAQDARDFLREAEASADLARARNAAVTES